MELKLSRLARQHYIYQQIRVHNYDCWDKGIYSFKHSTAGYDTWRSSHTSNRVSSFELSPSSIIFSMMFFIQQICRLYHLKVHFWHNQTCSFFKWLVDMNICTLLTDNLLFLLLRMKDSSIYVVQHPRMFYYSCIIYLRLCGLNTHLLHWYDISVTLF